MVRSKHPIPLALLLSFLLSSTPCCAFVTTKPPLPRQHHALFMADAAWPVEDAASKSKTTVINIDAVDELQTQPLPSPSRSSGALAQDLVSFLQDDSIANLLFNQEARFEEVPASPTLTSLLKCGTANHRSQSSNVLRTRFVELHNAPMPFIGITLGSTTTLAVELVHQDPCPELQFTLLSTEFQATGPRPLVWIFHKVLGGKENARATCNPDHPGRFTLLGFTRLFATSDAVDTRTMRFTNAANLQAKIEMPKMLLKILPMSLEDVQRKGSATLQASVRADLESCTGRLEVAYQEWLASAGREEETSALVEEEDATLPTIQAVEEVAQEEAPKPQSRLARLRQRVKRFVLRGKR